MKTFHLLYNLVNDKILNDSPFICGLKENEINTKESWMLYTNYNPSNKHVIFCKKCIENIVFI